MKKLLIASAALAMVAGAAQAQSSVTVYGIFDASVSKQSDQNNSNQDKTTLNSKDSSRIGFRGAEDLGGGLSAIFNLEGAIAPGTGTMGSNLYTTHTTAVTSVTTIASVANQATTTNTVTNTTNGTAKNRTFDRASVVGLKGAFGQVTVGRQQNIIVDTNAQFDAMRAQFTGTNPFILYGAGNSADTAGFGSNGADALGVYRQDNSVKYQGTFSGLTVNAMQAFGAVTGDNAKYSSKGLGASYKFNNMVTVGASSQEFKDANNTYGLKLTSYGAAITPMNGLAVRIQTAEAKREGSSQVTDQVDSIGATYAVTPKIDVTLAHYNVSRATVGSADQDYKRNYLLVEYNLSKRTALYGSLDKAKYNSATSSTFGQRASSGSDSQSLMNIGVSHKF
jgi:predicted porin